MLNRLLTFTLLLLMSSCAPPTNDPIAEKVEVATFSNKLATLTEVQLIDVRTPEEFALGAIENAVNIDFYGDNFDQQIQQLDKQKPVMVYCQSGAPEGRSGQTLAKLKALGFAETYELAGGYSSWPK